MGRGYSSEEIREKLISVLEDSETGMSGVEISEKVGVNRITMTKYLQVFAADGLLRQKNIGNVILWFLEPGQESFNFPDDYFKITSKYIENLVKGTEDQVYSLIRNCIHSGASITSLILEVILPAIDSVNELYDDGKIGTSELNLLRTTISKSLQIFNQLSVVPDPKKNVIVLAADSKSSLISEAASSAYHSDGWRVSHLGDMSSAINVLFDLDFQKLIGKIWKKKPGILIVVVFSQTSEGLIFFVDSITPIKEKSGKRMKLTLCGKISKKSKINADLKSENLDDILQWSKTTFQNLK
ncbi:MAG TPA: ArsR family transcriptional regulator [Nitrosopumilus sp.]|jgi:methanogenic corrinoid protein MtbC1|nr:transcriptional regulator [Nitrososphaerota archaeon]HJL67080.1 ArsR family transcriptional regulator [Nitrosopumilus sp.]HJM26248.1 ArsR family transcriptional regulator [Nitrosopumilus sp.]HJO32441.1 ArsR family transcriptional regulator [Nitrosopumilus sp.]|tara:strand:+ start:2875 stop:3768 length:894 start_codon:yes stop_codon:yes gene_type:complete